MFGLPISPVDTLQICKMLHKTIAECMNATKEQATLRLTFDNLQGKITYYIQHMDDYEITPKQFETWHTALRACEEHVSEIHDNLVARSSSDDTVINRISNALSSQTTSDMIAALEKDTKSLESTYEVITKSAVEKSFIRKKLAGS